MIDNIRNAPKLTDIVTPDELKIARMTPLDISYLQVIAARSLGLTPEDVAIDVTDASSLPSASSAPTLR